MTPQPPGKASLPIGVYRMNQLAMQSGCILGDLCPTCRFHAFCRTIKPCRECRRKKTWECERAQPAPPAFTVRFNQALALVRQGLAVFIQRQSALRLTFSKVTQLRDCSLKVDEQLLMDYAQGDRRARAIIEDPDSGWVVQPPVVELSEDVAAQNEERVLYFA
jgi:hypothetical protein